MSGMTPDLRAWTGVRADAAWDLVGAAVVLTFVAAWVVVPPPAYALLPLAVGAPALSPVLGPIAATVATCAWAIRTRPARTAAVLASTATVLFAIPVIQVPAALNRFDAAMAAAGFGRAAAPGRAARNRSSRFSLLDLTIGVPRGLSSVHRAVPLGDGTSKIALFYTERFLAAVAPLPL